MQPGPSISGQGSRYQSRICDELSEETSMKSIRTFCLLVLASGMALGQASQPNNSNVADDLKTLRDAIAAQQKQIAAQQKQLEMLQKQLDAKMTPTPHVENAT